MQHAPSLSGLSLRFSVILRSAATKNPLLKMGILRLAMLAQDDSIIGAINWALQAVTQACICTVCIASDAIYNNRYSYSNSYKDRYSYRDKYKNKNKNNISINVQ